MCKDFIMGIGSQPNEMYFNKVNKYWELYWQEEDSENYLHLKIGSTLAQRVESGKAMSVIWVRFNHPVSDRTRMYPWYLTSAEDVIELVQSCRTAIRILHYS